MFLPFIDLNIIFSDQQNVQIAVVLILEQLEIITDEACEGMLYDVMSEDGI